MDGWMDAYNRQIIIITEMKKTTTIFPKLRLKVELAEV